MRWLDGITDSMDMTEQTPRDSEGQGSLACCSPWSHKESDMTKRLNNNKEPKLTMSSVTNIKEVVLLTTPPQRGDPSKMSAMPWSRNSAMEAQPPLLCAELNKDTEYFKSISQALLGQLHANVLVHLIIKCLP